MPDDDLDQLDGCDADFAARQTDEADVDGTLLFADIDFTDAAAVERRQAEWAALLPGAAP